MTRGLVVFGEDWGAHPSSTQHIVGRLAKNRDVVWVNSIGLRRPRLSRRDIGRIAGKIKGAFRPSASRPARDVNHAAGMSLVDPKAVSWPGSGIARAFNRVSLGRQLRDVLGARDIKRPILWASLPSAVSVLGEIGESAVVYYCGDDFGALAGVDHRPVRAMERELVERADLIFAASEELADRFPGDRTVLMPHGVDFARFTQPVQPAGDLPRNRPVAGFYGSIAEWIDIEMLASSARALPEWNFVLIGSVQVDVGELMSLPNVHFLGPRPHEMLPSYVQNFDVSLLPFRDTPQIRACNPLKLREYLAAGSPIATTDFPALGAYRRHVCVARDPSDFADAILRANDDNLANFARRASVAAESWDARARSVHHLLEAL
jgi:glycosyltransferase involved in cell wall biosynthesis